MSLAGVALFGLLGLFVASLTWMVAVLQAGTPQPAPAPVLPTRIWSWLPLWGFGLDRAGAARSSDRPLARSIFEAAVAVGFAVVGSRTADASDLTAFALFSLPLLIVLLVDWWTRIIYTNLIAVGTVLALVVASLYGLRPLLEALGGLACGAVVFGAFYVLALLLYRDVRVVSLGVGDVALAAMIGAMTGGVLAAVGTLFYGVLLAALGALLLLATRRGTQTRALPSGSYLCAGALIGLALQNW